MSDFLQLHGLQHARLLCPPPSPGVCSDSCPLSQWCYLTISSSSAPFSFPSIRVFSNGRLFTSGGQSIGASASASVLPMNIQDWLPLGWTALISCRPRDSQESFPALKLESINSSALSLYGPTLILVRDYRKSNSFDYTGLYWPCCLFCYNFILSDLAHGSDHTLINVESLCGCCSRIRPWLPGKESPGLAPPRPHLIVQCIPHR